MYMCSCAHRLVGDPAKTEKSESLNAKQREKGLPMKSAPGLAKCPFRVLRVPLGDAAAITRPARFRIAIMRTSDTPG